jgi:alpha-N-acetylglucosaminidase
MAGRRSLRLSLILAALLIGGRSVAATAQGTPIASPAVTPEAAARGVLMRLIPQQAGSFVLQAIPAENGQDVFEIDSDGGKVVVRGSSGVAIASGVNWYLKYYCHCHVSWCGDQLKLPEPLPRVDEKVRRTSPFRYRYCFNYCAFSYTLAFWDWAQWERMIDWMALNGVNMPLSVTGQEAIWQKVLRDFGLDDSQIKQFLVGPAYLPFGWMGCIDAWGGPLPDTWIKSHLELEKRIVARQRELGMMPVLQGFTGHVPAGLTKKFPQAKFQQVSPWCGFPATWFVDPTDPLFERIGKALVEEQTRQFSTSHLYASDTFIEMSPPSSDPKFLNRMGQAVYGAMKAADPDAVWVMQGWVFINNPNFWKPPQNKALLTSVPDDRMILLDLFCESSPTWNRTEAFYGKPWVWCIIKSFGGQVALYGGLPVISKNLTEAMTSPKRGKLSGIGAIMEGFGYNPIVYDLLFEMTWRTRTPELESWVRDFALRRYGARPRAAEEAWDILRRTAYTVPHQTGSIICRRPSLPDSPNGVQSGTPYNPAELAQAWRKLLDCADELGTVDTYRYDLVHVARQVLNNLAPTYYRRVVDAYYAKDRPAMAKAAQEYVQLIRDLDELLATRREFLLGRWLADARRWAANDQERKLYEWNARNLITLWGPRDGVLFDYAQRQWSGLTVGFFLPRWELLLKRMDEALATGKPLDVAAFGREVRALEDKWTHEQDAYPAETQGDPVAVVRRLWEKYGQATTVRDVNCLTTGKPATCSSSLSPYPAWVANDGWYRSTDHYWATDVNTDPDPWWQVDLEKPTSIGRVVIVFYYGDKRFYGFTLETSTDGKKWETAADHRQNKMPSTAEGFTCRFPSRAVRYLRVRVAHNSANTGRHLVEVMAFDD